MGRWRSGSEGATERGPCHQGWCSVFIAWCLVVAVPSDIWGGTLGVSRRSEKQASSFGVRLAGRRRGPDAHRHSARVRNPVRTTRQRWLGPRGQ